MFDELQDGGKGLKANTQVTRARLQFYLSVSQTANTP